MVSEISRPYQNARFPSFSGEVSDADFVTSALFNSNESALQ